MKGSLRIAKVFGIPVELHWTFGLLVLWIVYSSISYGAPLLDVLLNLLFILALFLCVVLHEFGHALTARRYGVQTRDIILSPIGGIARLDKLPEKPWEEILVAVAGPLVNVGIALLLLPYFFFNPNPAFFQKLLALSVFEEGVGFVEGLLALNLILATFNMLPAFPMDGGRIVRALLSIKLGRLRATRIASLVGQGFAILFVLWAFLPESLLPFGLENGGMITAFIGFFIFFTATQEYQAAKFDAMLAQHTVGSLARSQFTKLSPSDPVWMASSYLRQGLERYFLIFDEEEMLVGSLHEQSILQAIKANGLNDSIRPITIPPPIPSLRPDDTLKVAYEKLNQTPHGILPVIENDEIIGVIDVSMVNHFLQMEKQLAKN